MKVLKNLLLFNKYFVILLVFLCIYVIVTTKVITYQSRYDLNTSTITGTIKSYHISSSKLTMEVKAQEKIIVNYYFKNSEEYNKTLKNVHIGDTITIEGKIKKPINNTIPNTFNYQKYLYNKKIYNTFTASKIDFKSSYNLLYAFKDKIIKRIYKLDNADYLLVFILGDKTLLDSEEYTAYQNNGIAHLLAISGMHIGVLLAVLNFLLKKIKENIRFIIITLILFLFMFLTGFTASIMRVSLYFILNSLNKKLNFNLSNIQILILVASFLIIINPFIVYDLGFIYSFVITFGIFFYRDKLTGNYFKKAFKLSLITFLFSLPITALSNYEVNLTAILLNLLFIPLISIIVYPLSLVTFIIPVFSPLLTFFLKVTNYLNSFCLNISLFINIPKMNIILLILYYLILLIAKKRKILYLFLVIIILVCQIMPKLDANYYIYYLDVGQGDSTLLISPNKKDVIMIDTGCKVSFGTNTSNYKLSDNIIKFLKSIGVTKINYLILSHGDFDHMGEAINYISDFKVDKVVFNNNEFNTLEKSLINILNEKDIPFYQNISNLILGDTKIYFLNTKVYDNENDNSNVLYFNINNYNFLFMGDASSVVEQEIINNYNLANIDFLKVGHHGSKTSSSAAFINTTNPKYSIISVGKNNRYGHPNKEVINNLKDSKIYRTDEDGSIMFKIKKNKLKIETCVP